MLRFSCRIVSAVAVFLLANPRVPAADAVPTMAAAPSHPIIPGFERFYANVPGGSVKGGQLLLNELNCVSCHRPEAAQEANLLRKQAPVLDNVGDRVRRSYLRKFLTDPQAVKPGTAMPRLFTELAEKERTARIEALTHFLAATGALKHERADRKLIAAGKDLFHKVGCVACHGSRDASGNTLQLYPTSVPLGDLTAKYSIASLKGFLENPHTSRPSGRMPVLLSAKEAREVANYLLQGAVFGTPPPNLAYTYYEGSWDRLPAFDKLKPRARGVASGFDVTVARRTNDMALRFEGYLQIERAGNYRFYLTSDDGSKLYLDGKLAVSNDGIHAPGTETGVIQLAKGMHKLMAGVFNAGAGVELQIDVEGPKLRRQDVTPFVFMTPAGSSAETAKPAAKDPDDFPLQPALVTKGRQVFATAGCANCHQLNEGKAPIASKLVAPALAKLPPEGGCLAAATSKGLPQYSLSKAQRTALADALNTGLPSARPSPAEEIARTMTTFNCYACHQRDKVGGAEAALNTTFKGAQQEMGDEGRLPPPLDGVGAKLKASYLTRILDRGTHDRPYMYTYMPGFSMANVGQLVTAFAALDKVAPVAEVKFTETPGRVKADARKLVGALGLGCIKCHTFGGSKAEGLQGIDMTLMPQRLNHDWFRRYVADPAKFRPGTHMPSAWFNGKSSLPEIMGGAAEQQIEAIWAYLADGNSAQRPVGLAKQFLPLIPDKTALIYRNFIQGAGPRAIGVGYPEKGNLAFDANDLRLAMIWQGAFIDAARHWSGRGEGFEPPLGDNILHFPLGPGFAVLAKDDAAWPTQSARTLDEHFGGYRLSPDGRPTFLYTVYGVKVEDFPNAVPGKSAAGLRRELTLKSMQPVPNLWFRAAAANKIESLGSGRYRINGDWTLHIESSVAPRLRQSGGRTELLVPVQFQGNRMRIVEDYVW